MKSKPRPDLSPKTVAAIGEMMRAAHTHITGEDPIGSIDFTICRGPSWCGVDDDCVEVNLGRHKKGGSHLSHLMYDVRQPAALTSPVTREYMYDKSELRDHSKAKVKLLSTYLRNYLNVITNAPFTRVRIFDLFCGPGLYPGGGEGSPLAILHEVQSILTSRTLANKPVPQIDCYFSDEKTSDIQTLEAAIVENNLGPPPLAGTISCEQALYEDRIRKIIRDFPRPRGERTFLFLDPAGYKPIRATDIRTLLHHGAEVLLFLPIQFMYRFESNGTPKALVDFISELVDFETWRPNIGPGKFAEQLKQTFKDFLGANTYIASFSIEKDPNTQFCLYFFTSNLRGYEKMIEAKWSVDEKEGRGWTYKSTSPQASLLGPELYRTLPLEADLETFLKSGPKSNCEVYLFVLEKEFLPKYAGEVFRNWVDLGKLQVESVPGASVKKGAFYMDYDHYKRSNKKVIFKLV